MWQPESPEFTMLMNPDFSSEISYRESGFLAMTTVLFQTLDLFRTLGNPGITLSYVLTTGISMESEEQYIIGLM